MAQLFMGGKRMRYLLFLLLIALLLSCPLAYAEQTPQITAQPPTADMSAAVSQINDLENGSLENSAASNTEENNTNNTEENNPEKNETENTTQNPTGTIVPAGTITPTETIAPTATNTPTPTQIPEPQVRFSRDFSNRYAEYGSTVTLSYTVRNDGVLPITDITVRDGLTGKVGSIERLDPGERKTVSARVKVTQTCTSSPVISYEYEGESYTERCSQKDIYLADVDVRVELEVDKDNVAPGEYVTLRLCISNEGNVNLYSLCVSEPILGEMGSVVTSLSPGEEWVIVRTVQMKSAATFRFAVSGSSDTGSAFSTEAEPLSVLVTPVAAEIELKLHAQADKTQLDAPGEVSFSLYLQNECTLELRDVTLSEQMHGEIRTLAFVPAGEMPPITQTYQVNESGTYRFKAQMVDSVGDQVTVYSEPIYISVYDAQQKQTSEPSRPPEEEAQDTIDIPDGPPYRMAEEVATFERLIIWTVLLLIGVLFMWYVVSKVRRFMRRLARRRRRRAKKQNRQAVKGKQ